MPTPIYTIGHSTRPLDEFIALLKQQGITQLVDVRSIPRSRHNPQFEHTALEKSLPKVGISYQHIKQLGGLRPKVKTSINTAWRNASFRNYADYMQTAEFGEGLAKLIALSDQAPTAIMCAEAVPWRCHRSLIADALVAREIAVQDIISDQPPKNHTLTSFAVVTDGNVTYPAHNDQPTAS